MKKIKINKLLPKEIKETNVVDGFCPQEVINSFLEKHGVQRSSVLLFHLQVLSIFGRDGAIVPIETDDDGFFLFRKELEELLRAIYLEYTYNRKRPITFISKGGTHDQ